MTASHTLHSTRHIIIQNYDTSWTALQAAIKKTVSSSVFGNFFLGVPVCGSHAHLETKAHESLCIRWFLLAISSPLLRYAPTIPNETPSEQFSQLAFDTFSFALDLRRSLQHFYRTILSGEGPLLRPMFYNYPHDRATFGLDEQFMVGEELLVVHPVLPNQAQLDVYLPQGAWFEWSGGMTFDSTKKQRFLLDVVETDFVAFIKEGAVVSLVTDNLKNNTSELKLVIAQKCSTEKECQAEGKLLFWSRLYDIHSNLSSTTITFLNDVNNVESQVENLKLVEIVLYNKFSKVRNIKNQPVVFNSQFKSHTIPH